MFKTCEDQEPFQTPDFNNNNNNSNNNNTQVANIVHQELSTVDNQMDSQCRIVNMCRNPC